MPEEMSAGDWLAQNDPKRNKPKKHVRKSKKALGSPVPGSRKGHHGAKARGGLHPREIAAGKFLPTVKSFVEESRGTTSADCIFVQVSVPGRIAKVRFCGRDIPAHRYMCILTHGAPKSDGMVARHLCGNGHLNCINPNHIVWGSPSDNMSDAGRHRALGDDATAQDRIFSID